jgi:hypothetical protein
MLGTTSFESDFEDVLEHDFESDYESDFEYDEGTWDEAAKVRPRSFRPLKAPAKGSPTVTQPRAGFATKAELDATAKKLDARIATNTGSIKALDGRTRTMENESAKMGTALKKEIEVRKRQTTELRKGLDESRQLAMIVPLITAGADPNDKFAKMLPILLYSGAFGGSGSSGLGGDNQGMTMAMMALALSA